MTRSPLDFGRAGEDTLTGRAKRFARESYWRARLAPSGWRHRAELDGLSAEFRMATRCEFQRATTLVGEGAVISALLSELDGDEVVWDVGANVGMYACFVLRKLTGGAVVCFEPEPSNEARLRTNLAANGPERRWRTSTLALSDRSGPGRLASERREVGAGHHYLTDGEGESETEGQVLRVDCRRGDELAGGAFPSPDVVKIDVQGAELNVLRGMGDALDGVETAFVEVHAEKCRRYGTTAEEIEGYLRDRGFSLDSLGEPTWDRRGVYHVRARRGTNADENGNAETES
ncbi:FkbM family methyltransferase [Halogeometricum luteum]|uniref:FkbM family methyltransferase n=1 Tax=Halogeometricum luteum TaxID=2950537 RepID=A0ABU2G370_9EURY|nr:FkbM family methyltransferase [Halogeometricum sp. S3BR5-2]MDS0295241.1 FkbM family methyltransferase [Halogeometricum sp. S3BR5-2]